ncbi:hypothetical protein [Phenylobacterium sp.]|uniref:hypothetical protein n=1 Tax=Phenylobacterium sp. TaxID=1871053 RepID=UPI00301D5CCD
MATWPVHRRPRVERIAIRLLRGEDSAEVLGRADQGLDSAFAGLRRAARTEHLTVEAPGAMFLGGDERWLLGWLAVRQRSSPGRVAQIRSPTLDAAIIDCARRLSAQGIGLPPPPPPVVRSPRPEGASPPDA